MKPLRELAHFLNGWRTDLQRQRNYPALIEVEALQEITSEAVTEQTQTARQAYAAQQADLEAARLIESALSDGRITAEEIPLLRTAQRHVLRSAAHDHAITERAA